MKSPSGTALASLDLTRITATIQRALAAAGLDTSSGPMRDVTNTIERALAQRGLREAPAPVADGVARAPVAPVAPGRFVSREFSNPAGKRSYKLYVPAGLPGTPVPLVVMLHGCTQSADDFAAGTRMNQRAEEQGFVVVYPEQATSANPSRCWNWFQAQDQLRGAGEPSLMAGIVGEVMAGQNIDRRRIFVAGLSAGAAMAVVLGETYPELFAAVGAHSGLPYGSAHDIPSALAAMKGGRSGLSAPQGLPGGAARRQAVQAVPTIVFHGDRDHTVQLSNGQQIVQQASVAGAGETRRQPWHTSTHRGTAAGGRGYTRTVHADASGRPHIEAWTVHGAGHAWSGGDPRGSYTDAHGPDASAEMLRFFLAQPAAGTA